MKYALLAAVGVVGFIAGWWAARVDAEWVAASHSGGEWWIDPYREERYEW